MAGWRVTTDIASSEEHEWTTVVGLNTLNAGAKAWKIKPTTLSPKAANAEHTFLGWGAFAPEEYLVYPEDDAVAPELNQADSQEWTIVPEPE